MFKLDKVEKILGVISEGYFVSMLATIVICNQGSSDVAVREQL